MEKLRGTPEFAALEKKYGKLSLTFDNTKETGLTGNTINIRAGILSQEYKVDADRSINAFQDSLSANMSDKAYWSAIDAYEASLPEYYAFSMGAIKRTSKNLTSLPGSSNLCNHDPKPRNINLPRFNTVLPLLCTLCSACIFVW